MDRYLAVRDVDAVFVKSFFKLLVKLALNFPLITGRGLAKDLGHLSILVTAGDSLELVRLDNNSL